MKTFTCQCGNTLFFRNSVCDACKQTVAFLSDQLQMSSLRLQQGDELFRADSFGAQARHYRLCANRVQHAVCNWAVPADEQQALCQACRLNQTIPDLGIAEHLTLWSRLEDAKRHALYSLLKLELPVRDRKQWPNHGLGFKFLADKSTHSEFTEPLQNQQPVLTGHANGVITINIAEAHPIARMRTRHHLGESYRTLLGHFRHELGHYYWDMLIADGPLHEEFRHLFGDESADYATSLKNHYYNPANNAENFISTYASAHPWEDWAESWAHYLHMLDTLETAEDFGVHLNDRLVPRRPETETAVPIRRVSQDFHAMFDDWLRLCVGLNALNRSMGMDDAYPFLITPVVRHKLAFVHKAIHLRPRTSDL